MTQPWREPNPELTPLAPEFFVADVAAAVRFYVRAFGFERLRESADFSVVRLGEAVILFQQVDTAVTRRQEPRARLNIRIMVDDVDAVFGRAEAAGAAILHPLKTRDYGLRDFTCLDNNGFALRFATPL